MNYETIKATESIVTNVAQHHPAKIRNVLFTFLEKFTTQLYAKMGSEEGSILDSSRISHTGRGLEVHGDSNDD